MLLYRYGGSELILGDVVAEDGLVDRVASKESTIE